MNRLSPGNPINPLIGAAGVSAMPMSARVAHLEGQREDPANYLIMHAMGTKHRGWHRNGYCRRLFYCGFDQVKPAVPDKKPITDG